MPIFYTQPLPSSFASVISDLTTHPGLVRFRYVMECDRLPNARHAQKGHEGMSVAANGRHRDSLLARGPVPPFLVLSVIPRRSRISNSMTSKTIHYLILLQALQGDICRS